MLRHISHKTAILVMLVISLLIHSCTKLDDRIYSDLAAEKFVPTEKDLASLVGPAYSTWRGLLMGGKGWVETQEITADELVFPARPYGWVDGGVFRRMHQHTWTTEQDHVNVNWDQAYSGVTATNRVIYQIESKSIPVTTGKESLLAELRVLRASYYYVLLDLYGNVPIVTKFDLPPGFLPEQNTRQQVYDFIVKELIESLPLLSDKADQSTYGRFNQWGAQALLAKVYLNAEVYTGKAEWIKCTAACDAVINSGKYALESDQRTLFKTDNEGSKETVFAIPYDEKYGQGFNYYQWTLPSTLQATYNSETGGWGGICAIPQFIETYDPEDSRLKTNWIQGQQYAPDGSKVLGAFGTYIGKPLDFINVVPSVEYTEENHGFRLGKYEFKQGIRINMSNDVPYLRYADVLMMKAEAQLRSGNADAAASLVSQIRVRAFRDKPAKALVTGIDLQKGSIYRFGVVKDGVVQNPQVGADVKFGRFLDELAWEFNQEGRRRQDLIRFGVFTTKSWLSHSPNGAYRVLLPIPQKEIAKNPKLKQNPGY